MQPHDRAKAKHNFKTMGRNIPTPSRVVEQAKKKEAWALEWKELKEFFQPKNRAA
ncbi:hypothetical protein [Herbaspirillum aquaticum]|uniref:hypothetical protein n=1 Tax=Herbaspirillum aquaticum TaxID=568783 RepID=UPI0024DE0EC1|nr:hypothetical protein [Herbaspirillum aquaticum]